MTDLTIPESKLTIGKAANQAAARHIFTEYQSRKAKNTRERHRWDLTLFAEYLVTVGIDVDPEALFSNPKAWQPITWGIVEGFKGWQLTEGYSIASVNQRLSTVKVYVSLAARAGAIESTEAALIRSIRGYSRKEGKHIDERRDVVRIGRKKADWVSLSRSQVERLKEQPNTPQGRRDSLIIHLLADLGLRCGELAGLTIGDIDLKAGELRFYRPKVDIEQTHRLASDTLEAARRYLTLDSLPIGPLLRGSRKDGILTTAGMSTQAISARVKTLGDVIGIDSLSAHDLRHYWATTAARNGTPVDRLQQAGGWASPAMALRYVEDAKIANEGVRLE